MRLLFWRGKRVLVIELHGTLSARVGALNIGAFAPLIDRAFGRADKGETVVLDIESPGGSPVQSDLIAARIRRRAEERGVRVIALIGEVGASGGYWLACAADEIVANPMSVVGSIGVIGGGFGFEDAIARLGVRRRLYTAGANKARLDPFSPERPEDVAFTRKLMQDLHTRFKDWVRLRRGARLRGTDETLFDGSWMLGQQAMELGLIDRLGDLDALVKQLGGKRAVPMVFKPRRRGLLGRLPRLAARAAIDAALEAADEQRGHIQLRL
jgi:signal peptide peptidase SppA